MSLRQQINLYQPARGEVRQALSSVTFAIGLAVIIAGLIGFTVYAQMGVNRLNARVELLRVQSSQQQDVLNQLSEAAPQRPQRTTSQDRIMKLGADLKAREHALEVLRGGAAGQAIGFASRMEALARRHTDGVWLEHMQLSGVSGAMTLSGVAMNPSSVPQYLQSLSAEVALSGTRFDEFVIERPDAHAAEGDDEDKTPAKTSVPMTAVRFRAASRSESEGSTESRS
jgi:hypothetical protein